jgi:hypothetical protein
MARVLCIHGIAQELKSRESLLAEWAPSLAGGASNAGGHLDHDNVDMAFYGGLFRAAGKATAGIDIPDYKAGDIDDPLEEALLGDLYEEVAPAAVGAEDKKAGAARRSVAHMLQLVAAAPFFGERAQRVVVWFLKQVRLYLTDPQIHEAAQQTLLDRITDDTRVIVAHSLGSIIAYETLCAYEKTSVRALVTLGSPLAAPAVIPRLLPPVSPGAAAWPKPVRVWVNVADAADVVALKKQLRPVYGARIVDRLVHNGATMHHVLPYLTAPETGLAILDGLA